MSNQKKLSWKERILQELKKLSINVIYLWLLLSLFIFHREVILAQYHIHYSWKLGFAFVNALILAKFMLIADDLHAGDRFKNQPLAYSVLYRSAVFSLILMVCHILEEALVRVWHGMTLAQSVSEINGPTLKEIFSLGLIIFVVLIPFFATRELNQVLGEGELPSLLFGPRPKTPILPSKD
jgi:hypothetical protein